MASVLGSPATRGGAAAAAALGMAMQRTNILRDIDEDAADGRVLHRRRDGGRARPPLPAAASALLRDQIARADAL